jgi:hypothetical protein
MSAASVSAASVVVPATDNSLTLPLIVTIAVAILALVAIALYVRRRRLAGRLDRVSASASAVSATGVLVSALLVSIALGNAAAASAAPPADGPSHQVVNTTVDGTAPVSDQLDGFQLPTE